MEKFVKKYAIINSSKAKVKVSIKVAIKENLHEGKIISNILLILDEPNDHAASSKFLEFETYDLKDSKLQEA